MKPFCSFTNSEGRIILVGVGDDGQILGVDIGKGTVEDLINKIKFSIEPIMIPQIETTELKGKNWLQRFLRA